MKRYVSLTAAALLAMSAHAGAQTNDKPTPYQGMAKPSADPIASDGGSLAYAPPPAPVTPAKPSSATKAAHNPDAEIVGSPLIDNEQSPESTWNGKRIELTSHAYNPDADIVTAIPTAPNQIPEGTPFHARLLEKLAADTILPGTPFSAQMTNDVMHNGRVVIPIGSYIHGRVTFVSAGRRIGGQSTMRLTPEEVILPDGTHYHLRGIVTQTAGSNTKTDTEGYIVNRDHGVRTAAEYGMTAGSGAVIGAVVGGPIGAGVGSAVGAGIMTVHWLREKNAAILPVNSRITFGLSAPLTITQTAVSSMVEPAAPGSKPSAVSYVEPRVQN